MIKIISKIEKLFGIGKKLTLEEVIAKGAIIIDVRTVNEHRDGHIKGSLNISLDDIKKQRSCPVK